MKPRTKMLYPCHLIKPQQHTAIEIPQEPKHTTAADNTGGKDTLSELLWSLVGLALLPFFLLLFGKYLIGFLYWLTDFQFLQDLKEWCTWAMNAYAPFCNLVVLPIYFWFFLQWVVQFLKGKPSQKT